MSRLKHRLRTMSTGFVSIVRYFACNIVDIALLIVDAASGDQKSPASEPAFNSLSWQSVRDPCFTLNDQSRSILCRRTP